MSILITYDGTFDNDDLPVIPRIYQDGLIAAFRPEDSADSMVDLSANNVSLSSVGAMTYNEYGVQVGNGKGFILNATETPSFSYVVCYRLEYEIDTPSSILQVIGSRSNPDAPTGGASIMAGIFADDDGSGARLQGSMSISNTSGAPTNYRGPKIAQPVPNPPFLSPWQYQIVTYDADTRNLAIYEPSRSYTKTYTAGANTLRTSNQLALGLPVTSGSPRGTVTIAEASFYGKVLNITEISTIYGYSVAYLASKNITPTPLLIP